MFQIKNMNNKNLFFLLIFFFLFFVQPVFAQSDSLLNLINDLSENETYLDDLLLDLSENPVNINTATRSDLLEIPLITNEMADSIVILRQRLGRFKSKRQIRKIITAEVYGLIKEFITISEKHKSKIKITQRNSLRLERINEIESEQYLGSILNNYSRIKYQHSPELSFGFIAQKDPDESNYIDHLNFAAQYKKAKWNLIAGDYYLQFGQGLSHSNPYGNQKSIYLSAVFREATIVARPNLTSSESTGKYGLFGRYHLNDKTDLFSFYSKSGRDVKQEHNSITGFKYDGLHRNSREIESKDLIHEKSFGAGLNYSFNNSIKIGALYSQYAFDKTIQNNFAVLGAKKRRQIFAFEGNGFNQLAFSYNWKVENVKFSGEFSQANKGGPGWVQSAFYTKEKFRAGVKYWRLAKDFLSADGRAFDDSNPFPQGVTGYFAALQFKIIESISFGAFKLYEQQLWRSYFEPMPTEKNEWLGQLDWKNKTISTTIRYRDKQAESFEEVKNIYTRLEQNQKFIRLELKYSPTKIVKLKTRWEHTFIENSKERGTLFYQDFEYKFFEDIQFNTRFTFFNTTSFDSRLYEYERDLPGSFSNIALFNNGLKSYLLVKWKMNNNFSFWIKGRYVTKYETSLRGEINQAISRDLRMQAVVSF
ncbi:MAG: helix-hairpin-helix domain-containing protein [Calditrichaeota bacterium]|nr:MAG: helix-hairpin-helix domain-containing protein [Calditrichota bacterium]MBL1205691.1 helix-hairpin-helix domain-containing protein [Calditrichota bacterium]NOG45519.1 helix-hairpin-helix domain-containing protein [Calditrichota bacterium]